MNTSLCTRVMPGRGFPSCAINPNPGTDAPVWEPTIEGTCIRRPALTMRTRTVPVIPEVAVPGRSHELRCIDVALIEGDAIDEVIPRRIVHRRRIAGVVGRRRGIAAAARLTGPDPGLAEARRVHRGLHRVVLNRVDFVEQQWDFRVIRHAGIGGACGCAARRRGR